MKIIILAGGSGTRLWPLSRKNFPKQFLKLFGDKSLLQGTAERFAKVVSLDDIIVITNKAYEFNVRSDLPWLKHIILEPAGRNTAPAIALAVKYATEQVGCGGDEIVFVCPSDHIIEPVERFREYLHLSELIAKEGMIVTLGIKPDRPETGYGYIRGDVGSPLAGGRAYKVAEFVEKPALKRARDFCSDGNYYWNSGMFAFSVGTMKEEFRRQAPQISEMLDLTFQDMLASFESMPSISIDYAVMERSPNAAVIPAEIQWNDIGSWDALFEARSGTEKSNGNNIAIDCRGTEIIGNHRLVAAIDLEDCVIVDTDDALLVARRGSGQKVRQVMELLTESGREEALEHVTTHRPWGSFTNLEQADRYKIKKLLINPGEKLSLQFHGHRSEHWVVVRGRAKVTVGSDEKYLLPNDSVYIPELVKHRVENPGLLPLEIVEVQYGSYLGEDDITRIEDVYGRVS